MEGGAPPPGHDNACRNPGVVVVTRSLPPAAQTGSLREPLPRALLRLCESIAIPGWRPGRLEPLCVRHRATERKGLAASRALRLKQEWHRTERTPPNPGCHRQL